MPATMTKARAAKLLNATEMKLYEESRVRALRALSASQIDRRVTRMRDLRDRARDLLQRQRVALRERTGSKRGQSGDAVQQRSKEKLALLSDMLKRFEGQLKIARKAEAAGSTPSDAPRRHTTRKAAKTRSTAPGKDFTAARMRSRRKDAEEAGDTMRSRASSSKAAPAKAATRAAAKATQSAKTVAKKAVAKNKAGPASAERPADVPAGGITQGRRTASVRALNAQGSGNLHAGYPDARAHNVALERRLEAGRKTPIQGHVASRDRRNQAKRDGRG